MEKQERMTNLKSSFESVVENLNFLKKEIKNIDDSQLDLTKSELDFIEKIKDELKLNRVGTWNTDGPGSDDCWHCTAGSGA